MSERDQLCKNVYSWHHQSWNSWDRRRSSRLKIISNSNFGKLFRIACAKLPIRYLCKFSMILLITNVLHVHIRAHDHKVSVAILIHAHTQTLRGKNGREGGDSEQILCLHVLVLALTLLLNLCILSTEMAATANTSSTTQKPAFHALSVHTYSTLLKVIVIHRIAMAVVAVFCIPTTTTTTAHHIFKECSESTFHTNDHCAVWFCVRKIVSMQFKYNFRNNAQ